MTSATAPPASAWASPLPTSRGSRSCGPNRGAALGAVFVAMDSELHRQVPLKPILDKHGDDRGSRQRFGPPPEPPMSPESPERRAWRAGDFPLVDRRGLQSERIRIRLSRSV